jgi:hypothetical protein
MWGNLRLSRRLRGTPDPDLTFGKSESRLPEIDALNWLSHGNQSIRKSGYCPLR